MDMVIHSTQEESYFYYIIHTENLKWCVKTIKNIWVVNPAPVLILTSFECFLIDCLRSTC